MVNEFLLTQFKEDEFKLIHQTYACDIKMSEIENGDFKWEYGGFWGLFIDEKVCDMEHVEEFAVKYAKYFYECKIGGEHRIQILHEFPTDEKIWSNYDDFYRNYNGQSVGFYTFSFDLYKKELYTSIKYYIDAGPLPDREKSQIYKIEEWLKK